MTGLVDALDAATTKGLLISDTSGNAETFFKYKGTLTVLATEQMTPENYINKISFALFRGGRLVFSLTQDLNLYDYLNPDYFPIEILNRDNINENILNRLRGSQPGYLPLHDDYRAAVIIPTNELPAWAQPLIDQGHLDHVVIRN